MSKFFGYFPRSIHSGIEMTNITRRVDLKSSILGDPYVYYPYQIEGDDRAEDIAHLYYGNVKHTWLVWASARVRDPFYDWPISSQNFDKFIMKKYAELSGVTGQAVVAWTQNTLITDNILYYENSDGRKISKDTYTLDDTLVADDWSAVRYYDYELGLNDDKRIIDLLDKRYASQAEREIKALLNA